MGVKETLKALAVGFGSAYVAQANGGLSPDQIKKIDFEKPTVRDGEQKAVIFGTCTIESPGVAWFGDLSSSEIKKDDEVIGYKYYVGCHLVLCQAPIDEMRKIKVDDVTVYSSLTDTAPDGDGYKYLNKENIFGGKEKDGGILGGIWILDGNSAQTVNTYLGTILSDPVPAFRGVVSFVMQQLYIGTRNQMKRWAFEVTRIHSTGDYETQWYDAKSEILNPTILIDGDDTGFTHQITEYDDTVIGFGVDDIPTTGWSYDAQGAFGDLSGWTPPYAINHGWASTTDGSTLWFMKNIQYDGKSDIKVSGMRPAESVHWMAVKYGVYSDGDFLFVPPAVSHPDSNGFEYFEYVIDAQRVIAGNIYIVARMTQKSTLPASTGETYAYMKVEIGDVPTMNGVHIIREMLSDSVFGRGFTNIDTDTFEDSADVAYSEGMGICLKWDSETSAWEFIDKVKRHLNAEVYPDRADGNWKIKLIRDDYSTLTIPRFDESEVGQITNYKKQSIHELINTVSLTYKDIASGAENTITYQDMALVHQMGGIVKKELDYDGFVTAKAANKAVARDMKIYSTALDSCVALINRSAMNLNLGDAFVLHMPDDGFNEAVMRCTDITIADVKEQYVRVGCIRDVFSTPVSDYIVTVDDEDHPKVTTPNPIAQKIPQEEPYFRLWERFGKTMIDILLASNNDLGYLITPAAKTSAAWIGAEIDRSKNATDAYRDIGDTQTCPCFVLDEDIGKTETTFEIVADTNVNSLSVIEDFDWFQIGNEFMSVVSVSLGTPNTITVKRGIFDTVPIAHGTGDYALLWHEYELHDALEYTDNDYANVKYLTRTSNGLLDFSDAIASTVIFESRAFRPYPPGDFEINGEYFPAEVRIDDDIVLTWVHRNRNNQTIYGFFDASITSESSVTYTVTVRDPSDMSVVDQTTGITAETHTITADTITGLETAIIELESVRDGYESYTKHSHTFTCTNQFQETIQVSGYEYSQNAMFDSGDNDYVYTCSNVYVCKRDITDLSVSSSYYNASGLAARDIRYVSTYIAAQCITNVKIAILNKSDLTLSRNVTTGAGGVWYGLATDGTYLYTARQYSNVTYLSKITPSTGAITEYSLENNIGQVAGIEIYGSYIYFSNTTNNYINIRNLSDGSSVGTYGSSGTGDANFSGPTKLKVIGSELWVLDTGNARIKRHDITSSLAYIAEIAVDSDTTGFDYNSTLGVLVTTRTTGTTNYVKRQPVTI